MRCLVRASHLGSRLGGVLGGVESFHRVVQTLAGDYNDRVETGNAPDSTGDDDGNSDLVVSDEGSCAICGSLDLFHWVLLSGCVLTIHTVFLARK